MHHIFVFIRQRTLCREAGALSLVITKNTLDIHAAYWGKGGGGEGGRGAFIERELLVFLWIFSYLCCPLYPSSLFYCFPYCSSPPRVAEGSLFELRARCLLTSSNTPRPCCSFVAVPAVLCFPRRFSFSFFVLRFSFSCFLFCFVLSFFFFFSFPRDRRSGRSGAGGCRGVVGAANAL